MKCAAIFLVCAVLAATTYAQSHKCASGCAAEGSNADNWCSSECAHCNGHLSCDTNLDACMCHEDPHHPPHHPDNHPDNHHP